MNVLKDFFRIHRLKHTQIHIMSIIKYVIIFNNKLKRNQRINEVLVYIIQILRRRGRLGNRVDVQLHPSSKNVHIKSFCIFNISSLCKKNCMLNIY